MRGSNGVDVSKIYVSHPFSNDPEGNRARTIRIAKGLILEGHFPIVPHLYLPAFLDEFSERQVALNLCLQLVALSDELRFYGSLSAGMRLEIEEARALGIPIVKGELP
jgi:hypothetical protein